MQPSLSDFGIEQIYVEITNACNMHCKFCPSDNIIRPRKSMNPILFKKTIDQIIKLHPPHPIAFHVLGEPLLHKNVFDFINYCNSKNLKIYLFTNCINIKQNIAEICKKDNIDALVLSMQTPTRESYKLRGSSKDYEDYMQDIYDAIDYIIDTDTNKKMRVEIHLAETRSLQFREWDILTDDEECLQIVKQMCRRIKHTDEDFNDIPENFLSLQESEYWGYRPVSNVYIRIKHFGTFGGHSIPLKIIERTKPTECEMAKNNLCILSDGTITICCLDTEGELSLGNIQDTKILDALRSKKRCEIIADVTKSKLCRRCLGTVIPMEPGKSLTVGAPTHFQAAWEKIWLSWRKFK